MSEAVDTKPAKAKDEEAAAAEGQVSNMLSERFVQALMHDLVRANEEGQDVNGKFMKVEVILEIQSNGKMLRVVQQEISEVIKGEEK